MTNKDAAGRIRMLALKHMAVATDIAEKLMALADDLDPPREPAVAKDIGRLFVCDSCGLQVSAPPRYDGEICGLVGRDESPCPGRLRAPREPAVIATCDVCGLRIAGREYVGSTCGAGDMGMACPGTFRIARTMATTRANSCTCDRCGDQILGVAWLGEMCQATVGPGRARVCLGVYRLDPEPDEELTTTKGVPYGVTRDELAMQAVRDFVHGHGDKVPDLDMATTYGGRS